MRKMGSQLHVHNKGFSRYRGCPLYTKVRLRQGRYNFYEERKCITIKVTSTLSYFTMHSFLAFEFTVFSKGTTSQLLIQDVLFTLKYFSSNCLTCYIMLEPYLLFRFLSNKRKEKSVFSAQHYNSENAGNLLFDKLGNAHSVRKQIFQD